MNVRTFENHDVALSTKKLEVDMAESSKLKVQTFITCFTTVAVNNERSAREPPDGLSKGSQALED